jgi:hypothetical protein
LAAERRGVSFQGGDIGDFHGEETIERAGVKVYGLRYAGGLIR